MLYKTILQMYIMLSDWMTPMVVIGRGRRGRDRILVGFHITTNVVSSNLANY